MMTRRVAAVFMLASFLLLTLGTDTASQSADLGSYASNRLIVVLKPAISHDGHISAVEKLLDQFGAQGLVQLNHLGIEGPMPGAQAYLGILAADARASYLATELARSTLVLRVEPDAPRRFFAVDPDTGPLDEKFQEGLQDYYFDIGVVAMWARGITGIKATRPITVAVIDSGIDLDHPDIDDNLVPGYDFVESDQLPQDESSDNHGSLVGGVIGAEINNDIVGGVARGVAGIGGGDVQSGTLGLRIMVLRIDASCAQSAQAIDYATTHGARVINMSYGGEDACQLELEAVERAYDAGIALVAGAGNDNSSTPFYPAAYGAGTKDHLVIAVAGVYSDGTKGYWSNYGEWIDVCAPYRQIYSITKDGGYDSGTGTSFSAPFISGLAGLLISNYSWSRDAALTIILSTADSVDAVNPSYEGLLGAGRINADRASPMINRVYLPLVSTED